MAPKFEYVSPDQIQVGDIIACYRHDDQWEHANARVVAIEYDNTPGVWKPSDFEYQYDYRLWLICRHVSLKQLDATGGPEFRWHRFPWNGVTRYKLSSMGKGDGRNEGDRVSSSALL